MFPLVLRKQLRQPTKKSRQCSERINCASYGSDSQILDAVGLDAAMAAAARYAAEALC